ncbi:MAG: dTDP-4-dehydrorhamnose 3,5-epimerase, partial [Marinilabiliales bacterium]
MEIQNTSIQDLFVIKPRVFEDERGYFFESYNEDKFFKNNIKHKFIQDNQSKSEFGVIRGLHYQLAPFAQTKLVRVLEGNILDVAVDIRQGSPTFGKSFSIELTAENKLQLLVPKGFAHGFSVISTKAVVLYKCDNFYNPEAERGINFNSKTLKIDWKIPKGKEIVATRDKAFPEIEDAEMNFIYEE